MRYGKAVGKGGCGHGFSFQDRFLESFRYITGCLQIITHIIDYVLMRRYINICIEESWFYHTGYTFLKLFLKMLLIQ